jgi:hypothetical protein
MLRIERFRNEATVFRLIGRMNADNVAEVQALFESEAEDRLIVLDLKDLTLVDLRCHAFIRESRSGIRYGSRHCGDFKLCGSPSSFADRPI